MGDGFSQRSQIILLLLHLLDKGEVTLAHLCPAVLRLIGQNLRCLAYQMGGGSRNGCHNAAVARSPLLSRWWSCFKAGGKLFFLDAPNRATDLADPLIQTQTRCIQ